MIAGFTGTREGLTTPQKKLLTKVLSSTDLLTAGHHGDCMGADAEFHHICVILKLITVAHIPDKNVARAFCYCDEVREAKPYLVRNKNIVKEADLMIACPAEKKEKIRSGTWSTIRYADKIGRLLLIIYPDGTMQYRNRQ